MRAWDFYTSKEIKPSRWLRRQLEIQANGLSGNLDKVWRDVRDSSWIGGDADGWERVPYWLDGFIPLAYLIENEDMISRAKKYVDAIVSSQKPDGWICPCSDDQRENYDTWAVILLTKVLVVYYECSGDERIPKVIYDALKNYYELLRGGRIKLFRWGKFRWFEGSVAIGFTYKKYPEEWLISLAKILKEQGADYNEFTNLWKRPMNAHRLETHIVNIAMVLKYEAITCELLGEEYTDRAGELYDILYEYNSTPVELFTGDECLSGRSPIQGTELCAVVEQMYSYEHLFAYTGDKKWAEKLEIIAFNALGATISDDMWTHQYDQMSNQIACQRFSGKPIFRTNGKDAHLFGLEPHFGCCTANFNQGWPKFAISAFMHKGSTILNAVAVPSKLDCDKARITLDTDYPFENTFKYDVLAKEDFTFKIRVPSFAKEITVDGERVFSEEISFDLAAGEHREISVSYKTTPEFVSRPYDLKCVRCGSLVFSLPIKYEKRMLEYERNGVERKFPYCDYEYIPRSDWSFGFASRELSIERKQTDEIPFSSEFPALVVKAKLQRIDWGYEEGYDTVCAKTPQSKKAIGEAKEIELYPYACAKLRMTELPFVD